MNSEYQTPIQTLEYRHNIDSFLLIWVLFQHFQEDTCFEFKYTTTLE